MHPQLTAQFADKDGGRTTTRNARPWWLGVAFVVAGSLLPVAAKAPIDPPPPIPIGEPASGPRLGHKAEAVSRTWSLRQTPVVDVVRRVRDAVVNIHSERTVRTPSVDELFGNTGTASRVNGMGTGILIDPRGYIITNQHVVEDVALIRVRLADGTTANARVLARDHECDLALLKIDTDRPLPTIPLGTTRDLMVGETVVAIGNAYGYEHTVTVGVVSAKSRDVTLNKEVSYKALIQTDASINPGNSGGPLLNVHGELIGVNVAIRAGAQGIGFAIPVDSMIRVAGRMLSSRAPRGGTRARLGMGVKDDVRAPSSDVLGETASLRSVVVDYLEQGGPAARAGLTKGDVLLAIGDKPIASSLDLERAVFDRSSDERVVLRYRHGGMEKTTRVALESSGSGVIEQARTPLPAEEIWQKLGVRLRPVGAEAVNRSYPQFRGGLSVAEVRSDSPADRAGVQRGDILVGLHKFEMLTSEHVQFVLNHPDRATFNPLKFYVLRSGQLQGGKLQLSD
jgi:serine protease Do